MRRFELPGYEYISILAPAWGASVPCRSCSLPTLFQFSPPRGGRPFGPFPVTHCINSISILAPAWGASLGAIEQLGWPLISILAPAWGASRGMGLLGVAPRYFNSRPRVGGVRISSESGAWWTKFQFSPPRGGRPVRGSLCQRYHKNFNSRPRVGGVLDIVQ